MDMDMQDAHNTPSVAFGDFITKRVQRIIDTKFGVLLELNFSPRRRSRLSCIDMTEMSAGGTGVVLVLCGVCVSQHFGRCSCDFPEC